MTPTLIVLGFVALGVAIVAFATRRGRLRADAAQQEQDTAWGEPPVAEESVLDPFAHAPVVKPVPETTKETERQS